MDQDIHNRKKRTTRSSEDPTSEKKIKLIKRQQQQQQQNCHNNNNNKNIGTTKTNTTTEYGIGNTNRNSMSQQQHDHGDAEVAAPGVFDFPWLKDGGGEWKLEDAFVSQLGESSSLFAAAAAGIEYFSFPGHCLLPKTSPPAATEGGAFLEVKFDEEELELCPPLPLQDIGFETAESLDCIWSAFA